MKFKILIFTGNELRHKFFANQISKKHDVAAVFYEEKANVHKKFILDLEEQQNLNRHFSNRFESEKKHFKNVSLFSGKHFKIKNGEINKINIIEKIKSFNVDYIFLYGSSIICDEILNLFPNRVLNLHLGLSPYYRGSGTNFFPLVDNLPECVGATIHLAVKKIDAGGVLAQCRPDIDIEDTVHDIGNKSIIKATEIFSNIIFEYQLGNLIPKNINLSNGKLMFRKDFNVQMIKNLNQNFKNGMIKKYLQNKTNRDLECPIIN